MMIKVQLDVSGNFTIDDYNYAPECARQDEYLEIKSHFEQDNSDKFEFLPYVAPVAPEPTKQQQIDALEAKQTKRMLRGAVAGDKWAIDKLSEIEKEIEAIRAL